MPTCRQCPKISPEQDTLEFVNEVRRFVAQRTDFGMLENEFCDNFLDHFQLHGVDTFLTLFELDAGKSACGLNAMIMVQILLENGIDAYTYNFGFEGTGLTHVVVLVKHHDQLLIFDPYLNYALLRSDLKNMDIISLIGMVASNNLEFRTTTDTVLTDLLIDEEALNRIPGLRDSIQNIPACVDLLTGRIINNGVGKTTFLRCYDCEYNRACFNMIKRFEEKLMEETGLHSYHEALVLKIGNIWGAADSPRIEELIESAILKQSGLGNRVSLGKRLPSKLSASR